MCLLKLENNFREAVFSLHHVGPQKRAQAFRFGDMYLYPVNSLATLFVKI